MIARLTDDHANARRLGERLADVPGVRSPGDIAQPGDGERLDPTRVTTSFVLFRVDADRAGFLAASAARGVLFDSYPHGQIRAATHHGISAGDVDRTAAVVADALREVRGGVAVAAS